MLWRESVRSAWLAARPRFRVLRLEHREILTAPERAAQRLAGFCGLSLDSRAMAAVVDPALHRQR